jgi:hypothetical protein
MMNEYNNSITLNQLSTKDDRDAALHQIYAQVLERQPYQFEHKQLAEFEQDFLKGKLSVKRFLKCLGGSDVYLESFYHNSSNYKFLDWCFKHFMGRAPQHQDEIREYNDILMREGPKALVSALIDSEEYRKVFGNFTVPHPHEQSYYDSPKAFWETNVLTHEHFGQRGCVVSTMNWHALGLDCEAGVCQHPIAAEMTSSAAPLPTTPSTAPNPNELLEFLKALGPEQARQLISSMTPEQKKALYQVIH